MPDMPNQIYLWIGLAGVAGLLIGFAIGYFSIRQKTKHERKEIHTLRFEAQSARETTGALQQKLNEKDVHLLAAQEEIRALQRVIEERIARERKAIDALQAEELEEVGAGPRTRS